MLTGRDPLGGSRVSRPQTILSSVIPSMGSVELSSVIPSMGSVELSSVIPSMGSGGVFPPDIEHGLDGVNQMFILPYT